MRILPFALRAVFSFDKDVRRLYWLLRTPTLDGAHRLQLLQIRERATHGGAWAAPGDRETIRVIFNLHRSRTIRVTERRP